MKNDFIRALGAGMIVNAIIIAFSILLFSLSAHGECVSLLDTPPRGIACLHCNFPTARTSVETISETLASACLKRPAINFLVDGTFSFNSAVMEASIEKISQGGAEPQVEFYLLNGPGQRRWEKKYFKGLGTQTRPEEFRRKIMGDPKTRDAIRGLVTRLLPLIQLIKNKNGTVYLTPMLEDNLDDESFREVQSLIVSALSGDVSRVYVRSPCPNCYHGNGRQIPVGVRREIHTGGTAYSDRGAIVTNDGFTVDNISKLRPAMLRAGELGGVFILWNGKRQGTGNGTLLPPEERRFASIEDTERNGIISLLRNGVPLPPVPPVPVPPPSDALKAACKKGINRVTRPILWKPESQGTNDNRQGKPVFIHSTANLGKITLNILDINAKLVGTLGYFGKFVAGTRYYSGWHNGSNITASEMAARAIRSSSNPNVYIQAGSTCYGPLDPRKRTGGVK